MKKLISVILCITFLCNVFLTPALADNGKEADPKKEVYYEIPVEYSNQVGKTETTKVMIKDGNAYMNASTVGEKSGYGPMIGKDTISLTNTKNFHQAVFSVKDTSVKNKMGIYSSEEYEAPYPSVINDKGAWIPLQYSWLLLNGSADIGDKELYVTLPTDNVLDALFDVLKNNHSYAYNIINNNGYSEKELAGEMNLNKFSLLLKAMGEMDTKIIGPTMEAKEVKVSFLGKDRSIWLYEVHLPNINENIDKKYAKMLGTAFCTMSAKELEETKTLVQQEKVVMSELGLVNIITEKNGKDIESSIDAYNKVVSELKKTDVDYNPAVRKLKELEKLDSDNKLFQVFGKEAGAGGHMLEGLDLMLTAEMYLDQFKNQDQFSMDALKVLLENGKQNSIAGERIMKPMEKELGTLSEDLAGYSVNTFIDCLVNDGPTKVLNYLATLGEDAVGKEPSVVLARLAFDIAMNWIPFYKEGFTEVEKFDLCNYASVVAADAHNQFVKQEQNVLDQKGNPSTGELYRLSQSAYSYLKFTYIARDAAIASVEAAMKAKHNKVEEDREAQELIKQQKDINKQIAAVLAKLKTAEKTNEWGCYGFLPEDNQKYLENNKNDSISNYIIEHGVKKTTDFSEEQIIKRFHEIGKFTWEWFWEQKYADKTEPNLQYFDGYVEGDYNTPYGKINYAGIHSVADLRNLAGNYYTQAAIDQLMQQHTWKEYNGDLYVDVEGGIGDYPTEKIELSIVEATENKVIVNTVTDHGEGDRFSQNYTFFKKGDQWILDHFYEEHMPVKFVVK